MNKFIIRVFRAIKIDADLYEEVEKDKMQRFKLVSSLFSLMAAGVGAMQLGASIFYMLLYYPY